MKILLRAFCAHEGMEAPGAAVIDLTPEVAAGLLDKRGCMAPMALDRRSDFIAIEFFDYAARFFEFGEALEHTDPFKDGDPDCIEEPDWFTEPKEFTRMECNCVLVMPTGVQWTALMKHTDVEVKTGELPWEVIERAAAPGPILVLGQGTSQTRR